MMREFWLTLHNFDVEQWRLSYSLNDVFESQVNQEFSLLRDGWRIHLGVRGQVISSSRAVEIARQFVEKMKAPG